MKHCLLRLSEVLVCLILTLSCCVMAPAMAQQDTVFMSLRLPSIDSVDWGCEDCALGSFTADALRTATDADFAIFCVGDLAEDLPQGELFRSDIEAVFAADREVAVAQLTLGELCVLLENLVGQIVVDMSTEQIDTEASAFDGFPCVSGMSLVYDAASPPGERVYSITLSDGTRLDLEEGSDAVYTVAGTDALFSGLYGGDPVEAEPSGFTSSEALYRHIEETGEDADITDWSRVKAIGARENLLIQQIPPVVLSVCLIAAALCMICVNRRRRT